MLTVYLGGEGWGCEKSMMVALLGYLTCISSNCLLDNVLAATQGLPILPPYCTYPRSAL